MKKYFAMLLLVCLSGCSFGHKSATTIAVSTQDSVSTSTPFYADVSGSEVKEMMQVNSFVYINASSVLGSEIIPQSINISNVQLLDKIKDFDKSRFYLVYSDNDNDCVAVASRMAKANFTHVYRLDGGLLAWKNAGLNIEFGKK